MGRIAVGICHDIRFPELAMLYKDKGSSFYLQCYVELKNFLCVYICVHRASRRIYMEASRGTCPPKFMENYNLVSETIGIFEFAPIKIFEIWIYSFWNFNNDSSKINSSIRPCVCTCPYAYKLWWSWTDSRNYRCRYNMLSWSLQHVHWRNIMGARTKSKVRNTYCSMSFPAHPSSHGERREIF